MLVCSTKRLTAACAACAGVAAGAPACWAGTAVAHTNAAMATAMGRRRRGDMMKLSRSVVWMPSSLHGARQKKSLCIQWVVKVMVKITIAQEGHKDPERYLSP